MSDAYYNKFPYPQISQPQPYHYDPYPHYQSDAPKEQSQQDSHYPSSQVLQLMQTDYPANYESTLKCLLNSLVATMAYEMIVMITFAFNAFEVRFPWQVLVGFICSIGDLVFLYLTLKFMKKSRKKKKKGKLGAICFAVSFILFKMSYLFTYSSETIITNDQVFHYSPSTLDLIMQYILRGIVFVMGILYLKRRFHFE